MMHEILTLTGRGGTVIIKEGTMRERRCGRMKTRLKIRCKKRNMVKWARRLLAAFLAYCLLGATLPFLRQREVSPEFRDGFDAASCYGEAESGEQAMLVEENEQALEHRLRMIAMAKEEILLSTFDFHDDESGKDVLSALLDAADRGVKVQVIVDGISGLLQVSGSNWFRALACHENAQIGIYNMPNLFLPWTTQGRMHDKYLLVDQSMYLLGGRNTYDFFLGNYATKHPNDDREVLVLSRPQGSAAALRAYFEGVWALDCMELFAEHAHGKGVEDAREALKQRYAMLRQTRPEWFSQCDYTAMTVPCRKITLLSNPTGIMAKEPWVFYAMTELMKTGGEVEIHSPYAVLNDGMQAAIASVCDQEKVRLVVNAVENGGNYPASADYLLHKKDVFNTGVELYEYVGGASYHSKSVTIGDRLSIVGSYNLDLRSTYLDTELMLVLDSEELNRQLRENYEEIRQNCRYVTGENTYIPAPSGAEKALTGKKRALLGVLKYVLAPFRFLI